MENINEEKIQPYPRTPEELLEREYKQASRELKIKKMRASVLRKQITEAYEILENIRFDYLSDTAFRDKVVQAKRGCESAITDLLLSDSYWESRIEKHKKLTPKQWKKERETPASPTQSKKVK